MALAIGLLAGCGDSQGSSAARPQSSPLPARAPDDLPKSQAGEPASTSRTATSAPTAATHRAPPRPPIVPWLIPYGAKRRAEMAAYAERHYGQRTWRLSDPRVIVEHVSVTSDARAVWNTFAPDQADTELHELPGLCSHFVVDRDGTIYQLVPTSIRCRHTVGLNWTAIGIEHVGSDDADVRRDPRQLRASLALTRYLRCRYRIAVREVIGHNESLSSPYHRELVAKLRTQTHGDMGPALMRAYRGRLQRLGC